jgi:hypothetical protein
MSLQPTRQRVILKHRTQARQQPLARLGRSNASRGALDEANRKPFLKLAQALAEGGRDTPSCTAALAKLLCSTIATKAFISARPGRHPKAAVLHHAGEGPDAGELVHEQPGGLAAIWALRHQRGAMLRGPTGAMLHPTVHTAHTLI